MINEMFARMPCWYLSVAVILSLYYAIRGVVELRALHIKTPISFIEKVIIFYVQDFLFKFIVTMSGFITLFVANGIFPGYAQLNNMSTGYAILIIFLYVWGILGICGYLTLFISRCKIPGMKE